MPPTQLTARETEVRNLAAAGLTNEGIAAELGLSKRTVEAHLRMVYRKTGLSRRTELSGHDEPIDGTAAAVRPERQDGRSRIEQLERTLAMRERQLHSYEAAMRRIIDRQFPLYDEKLEITIKIGSTPEEDAVTESHWSDPNPYLVYRVIRPITAHDDDTEDTDTAGNLAITCQVDRADVGVSVEAIADLHNRPRALVLFQPGLDSLARWTLHYRTVGLWNPLRRQGMDRLTWAAGTLDGRHFHGVNELRIEFEFPSEAEDVDVVEGHGIGSVEQVSRTRIVYTDLSRTGGLRTWRLRMKPAE